MSDVRSTEVAHTLPCALGPIHQHTRGQRSRAAQRSGRPAAWADHHPPPPRPGLLALMMPVDCGHPLIHTTRRVSPKPMLHTPMPHVFQHRERARFTSDGPFHVRWSISRSMVHFAFNGTGTAHVPKGESIREPDHATEQLRARQDKCCRFRDVSGLAAPGPGYVKTRATGSWSSILSGSAGVHRRWIDVRRGSGYHIGRMQGGTEACSGGSRWRGAGGRCSGQDAVWNAL